MSNECSLEQRTEFCHGDKLEIAKEYPSEKCIGVCHAQNKSHVTKKQNSALGKVGCNGWVHLEKF